jgi:hypothetical protein
VNKRDCQFSETERMRPVTKSAACSFTMRMREDFFAQLGEPP